MTEEKKKKERKEFTEVRTFSVPFALKENLTINSNTSSKPSKEQLINQAFKFHSQGNFLEAAKHYQSFIDNGFIDHRVYAHYGVILKDFGKLKEAEISQRKAIALKPDYAIAHSNLGVILLDNNNLQEAEISTRKAIELKPNLVNAHYNLGKILNALGEPYKAIESFREAIKYKPDYLNAMFNLGSTLINIREREEGKKVLRYLLDIELSKDINVNRIKLKNVKTQALNKLIHCLFHEGDFESTQNILDKFNTYKFYHSYKIGCSLGLDRKKDFQEEYQIISKKNLCDSVIGSVIDHANIIYEEKSNSTFCNQAINYIIHKSLKEEEFPKRICDLLISLIHKDDNKEIVRNGVNDVYKTKGNIFNLEYDFVEELKYIIETQLNNYKFVFRHSNEGFIKNWPDKYHLGGWLIDTKAGGSLKPHMHEGSWLSGSFYLKVPKSRNDEGNIAFNPKGPLYPEKGKLFPEKILNIASRDICIFPSSLFHYTIPFKSLEERICFVFDLMPS